MNTRSRRELHPVFTKDRIVSRREDRDVWDPDSVPPIHPGDPDVTVTTPDEDDDGGNE